MTSTGVPVSFVEYEHTVMTSLCARVRLTVNVDLVTPTMRLDAWAANVLLPLAKAACPGVAYLLVVRGAKMDHNGPAGGFAYTDTCPDETFQPVCRVSLFTYNEAVPFMKEMYRLDAHSEPFRRFAVFSTPSHPTVDILGTL